VSRGLSIAQEAGHGRANRGARIRWTRPPPGRILKTADGITLPRRGDQSLLRSPEAECPAGLSGDASSRDKDRADILPPRRACQRSAGVAALAAPCRPVHDRPPAPSSAARASFWWQSKHSAAVSFPRRAAACDSRRMCRSGPTGCETQPGEGSPCLPARARCGIRGTPARAAFTVSPAGRRGGMSRTCPPRAPRAFCAGR